MWSSKSRAALECTYSRSTWMYWCILSTIKKSLISNSLISPPLIDATMRVLCGLVTSSVRPAVIRAALAGDQIRPGDVTISIQWFQTSRITSNARTERTREAFENSDVNIQLNGAGPYKCVWNQTWHVDVIRFGAITTRRARVFKLTRRCSGT